MIADIPSQEEPRFVFKPTSNTGNFFKLVPLDEPERRSRQHMSVEQAREQWHLIRTFLEKPAADSTHEEEIE